MERRAKGGFLYLFEANFGISLDVEGYEEHVHMISEKHSYFGSQEPAMG
jgi:hypothetical protein